MNVATVGRNIRNAGFNSGGNLGVFSSLVSIERVAPKPSRTCEVDEAHRKRRLITRNLKREASERKFDYERVAPYFDVAWGNNPFVKYVRSSRTTEHEDKRIQGEALPGVVESNNVKNDAVVEASETQTVVRSAEENCEIKAIFDRAYVTQSAANTLR